MLKKIIDTKNDFSVTVARVMLGLVMFPHGAQKMLGWFGGYGFSGTLGFFTEKMGIPLVFALLAIIGEFAAALGLITGTLSRLAAFGIAAIMAVAVLTSHLSNGFFMNWFGNQTGEGYEYHLLAIALALVVMIKGGGAWSVDQKINEHLQ